MTNFLVTAGVLVACLISTYGWGRLAIKLFYRDIPDSPAYAVALGLGVLILIGGFLNLLRIAYPTALDVLFGLGLAAAIAFAAGAVRRDATQYSPSGLLSRLRVTSWSGLRVRGDVVPWLVILAATGFFAANLMPTSAFNFHDDFHKYLVSPFRMLQTGTLGGGPFEVMGRDHLGTQSFFQAFILTRFAPLYINGFDYVFCFLVAGLLVNDIGRKVEVHWLYRSVAMLGFVFIDPQYVNISALYSAALFILATTYAALLLADAFDAADFKAPTGAAAPVGLFVASLISLKGTFIPFALLLSAMLALGFMLAGGSRRRVAAAGGLAALTAAAVLVPWSAISVNNYANIIALGLDRIGRTASGGGGAVSDWGRLADLFLSRQELFYGGWFPAYNFAVLLVAVAALISGYLLWRNRERNVQRYLVVGLCLSAAAVLAYLFNAYLFAVNSGRIDITVRYFTPILIAVAPASVLVLGQPFWRFRPAPAGAVAPASPGALAMLGALVLVAGMFADVFVDRAAQLARYRTDLSFPLAKTKRYLDYNRVALTTGTRNEFLGIQSKADKGATILVWVSVPFLLDYARNTILTVESPGLVVGNTDKPFGGDAELFRKFLKGQGIRYVMWQFKGFGMRSERSLRRRLRSPAHRQEAKMYLNLRNLLSSLERKSAGVYKDDQLVLFDIKE